MQMKQYMKIAALVMVTVLCLLPLSAQVSSASSLQTVYSKSFDGMPYKEIDIDLGAEDFTLRRTASDKMTLEINARVNDNIPLVMQDTKSLKVIQKNKKRKVDGQICMVVLTYAVRQHHPVGAPPVPASRDAGFFFSGGVSA